MTNILVYCAHPLRAALLPEDTPGVVVYEALKPLAKQPLVLSELELRQTLFDYSAYCDSSMTHEDMLGVIEKEKIDPLALAAFELNYVAMRCDVILMEGAASFIPPEVCDAARYGIDVIAILFDNLKIRAWPTAIPYISAFVPPIPSAVIKAVRAYGNERSVVERMQRLGAIRKEQEPETEQTEE